VEDKLSIKVTIGNRQYPLSVGRDEEEGIRKAAALINDRIGEFGKRYAVRDMQDLLAMSALFLVSEGGAAEPGESAFMQMEKVAEIDSLLSEYLDKQRSLNP
jgi:cell division protein ZapA